MARKALFYWIRIVEPKTWEVAKDLDGVAASLDGSKILVAFGIAQNLEPVKRNRTNFAEAHW